MIEYIEINGTKHPVRINRKALIIFEKQTGQGISSLAAMSTESLSILLYLGVEEAYRFLKEKSPFENYESFEEVLDEMPVMFFYEEVANVIGSFFTKEQKGKKK
jgi:hypothetical protein